MRIFVFIERYPNPYKPYIDAQLVEFLRLGHEVQVFAGGAYRETVHQEVLRYKLAERTAYYPETLKDLPRHLLPALIRLMRAPGTMLSRIRHCQAPGKSLKSILMAAARMLVMPVHAPDLCLVHNLSTVAYFTFLPACYPNSRIVMYYHGGEVGGTPRVTGAEKLFRSMHAVFTNTKYSKSLAIARGCSPDKVCILPVGFSLPDYSMTSGRRYRSGGVLRIVSVGRMGQEKGFHVALEAVKQLVANGQVNIHYSLVGSGQQVRELQKFVEDNQLGDYVTFLGEMDKHGIISLLANTNVLVLPSLITEAWAETQACVVQEAMLMGLIVITTIAGGVPESIPVEMQAYSVAPGDALAISARITEILGKDEAALKKLGEAGRTFVVENYDIVPITRTLLVRSAVAAAG